jgi:NitT/TauT family transport system ATP-binding protein
MRTAIAGPVKSVEIEVPPSVELAGVSTRYRTADGEVPTLDDISFQIKPGEFVSVLGPSGCGKTTVLKMIAGLVPQSNGTVKVDGVPVAGPQRKIGIVFQVPALMKWRRVRDNVLLPAEILGMDPVEARSRADTLLALVGLTDFANRYPHELSGGMQQRVGIARALIHDPSILLLDEPFSALDAMTRNQLNIELLRIWSERRKASLLITHSIAEAVFLSDRVVVLGPRPAKILEIVDIRLSRPRAASIRLSPEFVRIVDRIGQLIGIEYV